MLDVTDSEKGKRGKGEKGTTPLPSAPFLLFSFSTEGGRAEAVYSPAGVE
jgi:hypothetical protein